MWCSTVFPELPSQYLFALDIGSFAAVPLTFKKVFPKFSVPVQVPPLSLSLEPNEDMFSFAGLRLDDDNDCVHWHDAFHDGMNAAFSVMRPIWESDFPFLHTSVPSLSRLNQEQRWMNIIKLALGWSVHDVLPEPEDCEEMDSLFDESCDYFEFNPCRVIQGHCIHFFGLTIFNYGTRSPVPSCPRAYQCSFCRRHFASLPSSFGYLCDMGCMPPIPLTLVMFIFANKLFTGHTSGAIAHMPLL
jgi:hypothetical protein